MFTVALVGPDGVGKTTIARQLEQSFPLPLKYMYMGDNVESGNHMLPTTRWWKMRKLQREGSESMRTPPMRGPAPRRGGLLRMSLGAMRKTFGFCNRVLEEAYREWISYSLARRGYIVLFDRHFVLDYYHFDIDPDAGPRSFKRRLHGLILRQISREPDLVICLDAPGEVVFRRKGEFTPDFLEMRRKQYRDFQGVVRHFELVNADRDLSLVVDDVRRAIVRFHQNRNSHVLN
jgi:thymidylate kinase